VAPPTFPVMPMTKYMLVSPCRSCSDTVPYLLLRDTAQQAFYDNDAVPYLCSTTVEFSSR